MQQVRSGNGLLSRAQERSWRFSAALAVGAAVFGLLIFPVLAAQHVVLFSLHPLIQTLAAMLVGAFAMLASVRYGAQREQERARAREALVAALAEPEAPEPAREAANSANALCDDSGRIPPLTMAPANVAERLREGTSAAEPATWSLDVLRQLDWKRYEELCIAFYRARRIRAELALPADNEVIDLRLYQNRAHVARCTAVARCRGRGKRRVDLEAVHDMQALMAREKVDKGYLMTQGSCTPEARRVARENQIALIDDRLFLAMLLRLPERDRQQLLRSVTRGDWATPTCPRCGAKMVEHEYLSGSYWICAKYPQCSQTLPRRHAA